MAPCRIALLPLLVVCCCPPLHAWTPSPGLCIISVGTPSRLARVAPAEDGAGDQNEYRFTSVFRTLRTVLMQLVPRPGHASEVRHFRGGMYGVVATVALDMRTRRAVVVLRGAPIGGRVGGVGWLAEHAAEAGRVVLEPDFARRLSARFVSIQTAALDRQDDTVTVGVTVPLFGRQSLTLRRIPPPLPPGVIRTTKEL